MPYPSSLAQKRRCAGQSKAVTIMPEESPSAQHHQAESTVPSNRAGSVKNRVANTNTTRMNAVTG